MKANYKDKIAKPEQEVAMGTLYDMNKQMMATMPPLTEEQWNEKTPVFRDWILQKAKQHYFMMLCHEKRDYTLFNMQPAYLGDFTIEQLDNMIADLAECLKNRGELLSAELQEDDVWEFWIKDFRDECCAYYLFPYGSAVLEY